ncbi:zinc-binding alcohol dehydrogenase [Halosegnis sp.]|uniref:zinc-dependent alcohol dehydrogenase n=1 Tax=Halosegnis sp. TaxID=2864959 RepID=UPI0035D5263F
MDARQLTFVGPREVTLREVSLGELADDALRVETHDSAISPGTELLVYNDEVPAGMAVDATIDALDGEFAYPLAYGYAAVGEVTATGAAVDDDWLGRRVFAFEPHADRFHVVADAVVPLPETVGTTEATLLPTVETATNLVLDGQPRVGERAVVFGAGPIGLCTTHLLAEFPLAELVVVEPLAGRRERARALGADRAVPPAETPDFADTTPGGADLVYELSGEPATLDAAVETVGYDGRVLVGSWYGSKRAPIDLGSSFHRDRISVTSSQVSTIAPALRGRWDTDRRFDVALARLDALPTDRLLTHDLPFEQAADAYRLLDTNPEETLGVVLTY